MARRRNVLNPYALGTWCVLKPGQPERLLPVCASRRDDCSSPAAIRPSRGAASSMARSRAAIAARAKSIGI
jgi:hypothetical protein